MPVSSVFHKPCEQRAAGLAIIAIDPAKHDRQRRDGREIAADAAVIDIVLVESRLHPLG